MSDTPENTELNAGESMNRVAGRASESPAASEKDGGASEISGDGAGASIGETSQIPELEFEALFNAVPCYVAVIDEGLEVIRTNLTVREHFGPHENKKCFELFKGRGEPCEDCPWKSTLRDRLIRTFETTNVTLDGREVMLLVTMRPVTDRSGRVVAVMEVSTDITELKKLQHDLIRERESRREDYRRVKQMFDEVPCYISVMDDSFRILETNRLFKENIGDVPGARCYELFKQRDDRCPECPVAETFADGLPHGREATIRSISGKLHEVVVRSTPIRSRDGRVRRVMEMAVDVTEVKDLQRELARLGHMAAHAAHNIKGILTGLKGGIFMVNEGRKRGDTPVVERGWEMVQHNVDRIATQSLDILSFAKKRIPEMRPVDLTRLMGETVEAARHRGAKSGVELSCETMPGAGTIEADAKLLGQALTVLVDNAIEACMEDHSGRTHEVRIVARPQGEDLVRIDVADNGTGMDEEVREHLFEDFYSTKGSMGTGLGLVVVKKIVVEHGGTVEFDTKPGTGTTFTIRLRVKAAKDGSTGTEPGPGGHKEV